jgi:hypothetical protein
MPARVLLLAFAALLVAAPAAGAALVTRPVGAKPLSDAAAAKLVDRSSFEPRPENRKALRRTPSAAQLKLFRKKSDMPNARYVTGAYRGTTDEVIQWAARKWGFDPDLLRAVAVVESWWRMSTVGDNGDSFGLFQMRRPYHCCLPFMAQDAAFNADYYGAILRSFYDGRQTWLNTVDRGRQYRAGDVWGSVGAWFSGRWYVNIDDYLSKVRTALREETWRTSVFKG